MMRLDRVVPAHGHAGGSDVSSRPSHKAVAPAPVRHPLRGVLTVIVMLASASGAQALDVPIVLTEAAGVARSADPVSIGVPVPRGLLKDTSRLCVLDAAGAKVPAQFEVLMHWWPTPKYPDAGKSIRWVLVDFQADVPAGGKAAYRLADRGPGPRPTSPVTVQRGADGVAVTTGPLEFTVSSKAFRLFDRVELDGKEVVSAAETDGLCVEGMDGKRYYAGKDLRKPPVLAPTDYRGGYDGWLRGYQHNPPKRLRVTVEKSGPVRTVVMIDGVMQALSAGGDYGFVVYNAAGEKVGPIRLPCRDEQIGFRIRIHAYAGKPFVRVFHTLINLRGKSHTSTDMNRYRSAAYIADACKQPGRFLIEAMELATTLNLKGPLEYRFGGDAIHAGQLDAGGAVAMYQDSSAGWIWQAAENKIYDPILQANAAYLKRAGSDKSYYEYSPIHSKILTGQDGCSFMGYRVLDGAGKPVASGNQAAGWADLTDGRVGLTTAVRWFRQMYPKAIELDGSGRVTVGLLPKQWRRGHFLDGKIHRTHELLYRFHGPEASGAAESAARAFNTPLIGYCDFDWYLASGACGLFARPDPKNWPTYEAQIKTAVHVGVNPKIAPAFDSSFAVEREKQAAFGWQHFGDTSKRGFRGHSQFQEFDCSRCVMMHYWRTGDPAFFVEAEVQARWLMGVPCFGGGYGHQHPESSHNWIQGLIDYYCMTGLPEAREGIDAMEGYYRACQNEGHRAWHFNGRNAAYALNGLRQFFELTGDPQWLSAANTCIRSVKRRTRPVSGFYGGNPGSFMSHVLCHALGRYALLTGDEDAVDYLVGLARYFKPYSGRGGGGATGDAYAYATMLTGDRAYLDVAVKNTSDARCAGKDGPHFRTGTASTKTWSGGIGGYYQVLFHALRRHKPADTTPPAAVADLAVEPGDRPGSVTLTWSNTGDDGTTGTAAKVQIKYAPGRIVELIPWSRTRVDAVVEPQWKDTVNFWYAENAAGEPVPGKSGARQSFTLAGLPSGKVLWFVMKVHDEVGNRSKISNCVSVTIP